MYVRTCFRVRNEENGQGLRQNTKEIQYSKGDTDELRSLGSVVQAPTRDVMSPHPGDPCSSPSRLESQHPARVNPRLLGTVISL